MGRKEVVPQPQQPQRLQKSASLRESEDKFLSSTMGSNQRIKMGTDSVGPQSIAKSSHLVAHSATNSPLDSPRSLFKSNDQHSREHSNTIARCCRCHRLAVVFCKGPTCNAYFCRAHDRSRHALLLFSRGRHGRTPTGDLAGNVEAETQQAEPELVPIALHFAQAAMRSSSASESASVDSSPELLAIKREASGCSLAHSTGARSEQSGPDQSSKKKKKKKKKGKKSGKPSTVSEIRAGYASLVNAIVRPPRCEYVVRDLGATSKGVGGGLFMNRRDFDVVNRKGMKLRCSMWKPSFVDDPARLPCVVYLHGNSSARVDVVRTRALNALARVGCTVAAFDFAGSGHSEGDLVTLGYFEQHDVADVLAHLKESKLASHFTIWGRSMGAVAALLYAEQYGCGDLNGLILDSPFSSFKRLCADLVATGQVKVPKLALKAALALIRRSVKKRAGADIYSICPLERASSITCASLFIVASEDTMIPPSHARELAKATAGPSHLIECKGKHNTLRPSCVVESVATFVRAAFRQSDSESAIQRAFTVIERLNASIEVVAEPLPRGACSPLHKARPNNYTVSTAKVVLNIPVLGQDVDELPSEQEGRSASVKAGIPKAMSLSPCHRNGNQTEVSGAHSSSQSSAMSTAAPGRQERNSSRNCL
jgi:pimeloyl-ACP methyl ester carboxylesterase